ncbi:hypothetical protein [Mesorhizobium australicum]|uniref:hypothetical protein n=1 Tax=Mesorhizobium australicum TaxID=536018 RepID=UPI003336193B
MKKPKPRREIVARALCWHDGRPQDTKFEGRPVWESYLPAADEVLTMLNEAGALAGDVDTEASA